MYIVLSACVTSLRTSCHSMMQPSLGCSDPEDRILKCVTSDISVTLRKAAPNISDAIARGPVESEKVRLVSLSTTEIAEITRLKKKKKNPIFRV